jgi:NitT/TauT family transport system substrate-binding protein
VILLADHGFNAYSTLIETRREIVDKKPDLVQRFVDASAIGWYNYLYGDNSAGNAMIKKMNPEMTDELLSYSVAKMKEYGIVDSGDTCATASAP